MSNRAQFIRACMAGASLLGAVLSSNSAFAQQGCCEGGSATGANAWTTGNTADETPANIAGAIARPPVSSFFTPIPGNPAPVGAQAAPANANSLPVKAPPVTAPLPDVVDPRRNRVRRPRLCQRSDARRLAVRQYPRRRLCLLRPAQFGEILRVQHGPARSIRRRPCLHRQHRRLYQADLWANNIGYIDYSYLLSFSKIGEQYFCLAGIRRRMFTARARRRPISGSEPLR